MIFDTIANNSPLRLIHPGQKALLTALYLVLTLWLNHHWVSIFVVVLFSGLSLWLVKMPARLYGRLLIIPVPFLLFSGIALAIETVPAMDNAIIALPVGGLVVGITATSARLAATVTLRSLAAVFILYFFAISTPFNDLAWLLKRIKVPDAVVELTALTYRFIFLLGDMATLIYLAQSSRLGYSSMRRSFKSLGSLAGGLYVKTDQRSKQLSIALESRCYSGSFLTIEPSFTLMVPFGLIMVGVAALLVVLARL